MLIIKTNKEEEIVILTHDGNGDISEEIIIRKGKAYGKIAIDAPARYEIFRRKNSKIGEL
jgi:sRNA-binding carbon storage regulator CsrA